MDFATEIIAYIGRFHPLVLHLPIGSLLMTFLLLLVSRFQKVPLDKAIRIGIDFSFAGAFFSALLGYFLSLDSAYDFEALKFHFWAGIITLLLTLGLSIVHRMKNKENLFFGGFLLTLVALSVTGHKGAQITHGDDFLSTAELFETPPVLVKIDSLDYYKEVVHPIFVDKCISCHNANKSKSELRLDRYDLILKGGERGSLFNSENTAEGRLVKYIELPLEDKLHMPPKNKSQLTQEEKWLLTHWVNSKAYLEQKIVSLDEDELLKNKVISFLGVGDKVKPADRNVLAQLDAAGFRIKPNALHDNLLRLKYLKKNIDKEQIQALAAVKDQLVELDLSHTNFNDDMATAFSNFPRLKILRMDNTPIGDTTLSYLNASNLELLNLCNTKVSYAGIKNILTQSPPKTIYAWNTEIDQSQKQQLASIAPSIINFGTSDLFSEELRLGAPELLNQNTIFEDSLSIAFDVPKVKDINIHYTLDGSPPDKNSPIYKAPFPLVQSATLKAKSIKKGWKDSETIETPFFKKSNQLVSYAIKNDLSPTFSISHHVNFTFEGNESVLFDGKKGERVYRGTSIEHGKTWLGVVEEDLELAVKIKSPEKINHITLSLLENLDMRTVFPKQIAVYGKSSSGQYEIIKTLDIPVQDHPDERISYFKDFTLDVNLKGKDELMIRAVNHMKFPDAPVYRKWKKRNTWIFIDEIIIW